MKVAGGLCHRKQGQAVCCSPAPAPVLLTMPQPTPGISLEVYVS